ncbi:MAG: hypothetical protein WC334_00695, partial [Kiritimatiellales bacterium]
MISYGYIAAGPVPSGKKWRDGFHAGRKLETARVEPRPPAPQPWRQLKTLQSAEIKKERLIVRGEIFLHGKHEV